MAARVSVFVEALAAETRVGINPGERLGAQPVELDVELEMDMPAADIHAGMYVDYDAYASWLVDWLARAPHTDLLEQLCLRMAERTFQRLPAVTAVRINLHKTKLRSRARRMGVSLRVTREALLSDRDALADRMSSLPEEAS